MLHAVVEWFSPEKGYGFLAAENGKKYFVHYSSISGQGFKNLIEGDKVTFSPVQEEKGLAAKDVVKL